MAVLETPYTKHGRLSIRFAHFMGQTKLPRAHFRLSTSLAYDSSKIFNPCGYHWLFHDFQQQRIDIFRRFALRGRLGWERKERIFNEPECFRIERNNSLVSFASEHIRHLRPLIWLHCSDGNAVLQMCELFHRSLSSLERLGSSSPRSPSTISFSLLSRLSIAFSSFSRADLVFSSSSWGNGFCTSAFAFSS